MTCLSADALLCPQHARLKPVCLSAARQRPGCLVSGQGLSWSGALTAFSGKGTG